MFSFFRSPHALRLFVVCLSFGFSTGCGPRPVPTPPDLPAGACDDRNWVAIAQGSHCPSVLPWTETALFQEFRPSLRGLTFCAYQWPNVARTAAPTGPTAADFDLLRSFPGLHGAVRRCNVISAAGQTLSEVNSEVMFRELRFQVGDTDLPFLNQTPGVQLAILDTYPTGNFSTAPNANCSTGHGHAIARIAQELTCDGTAGNFGLCAAEITTRLALPSKAPSSDSCGRYGSPTDLAKAILDEVQNWSSSLPPENPEGLPHLILNLSVGWDPKFLHGTLGAEDPDHLNAEELAVYFALGYAAQEKALAIAAAGNGHGGPQPGTGALLPAGWYASPPNTQPLSFSFLPSSPWPDPVVWPIGAVDRHGYRLGNSRPGAEPPLVAYSDHAVVELGADHWTEPLTGTSVAAAVASSFAAIVWHLQPNLQANDVMALLERSGSPLGRGAECYRPAGMGGVLVGASGSQRQAQPFPSETPPGVRRLMLNSVLSRAWSAPTAEARDPQFTPTPLDCTNATQITQTAAMTAFACPQIPVPQIPVPNYTGIVPPMQFQPLAAVPWVQTQPEANACPSCSLGGGGGGVIHEPGPAERLGTKPIDLLLEIPANWGPTASLTNLWLEAEGPPGQRRRVFISGEISPTGTWRITNLPLSPETEIVRLSATVKVDNKTFSVRMPIYVDPEK